MYHPEHLLRNSHRGIESTLYAPFHLNICKGCPMFRSFVYNFFYSKGKSNYICGAGNEERPILCPAGQGAWHGPPHHVPDVFSGYCKRACLYPRGIVDAGRVDVEYRIFEKFSGVNKLDLENCTKQNDCGFPGCLFESLWSFFR